MTEAEVKTNETETVEDGLDGIPEAPDFSIGEYENKIMVRVDSGSFTDTAFYYDKMWMEDGIAKYEIGINQVIYKGLFRDEMQLRYQYPEIITELHDAVATPILVEISKMAQHSS